MSLFPCNVSSRSSLPFHRIAKLAAFLLTLSAFSAQADTYYVATNGSDSNPGSEAAPFKRINFAYSKVGAGDTIIVKPGVYTEQVGSSYCFRFNKDGSASAPITIKSERVWGAVLDGKNDESLCGAVVWLNGSHHVIEGFEITNASHDGIVIYGSGGNRIISNHIHHNGNNGALQPPPSPVSSGITQASTKGDQFIANYIHHNGRSASHAEFKQNLDHGMYLHGDDMFIVNNIVANNRDHGIQLAGQNSLDNARIYNNVIASNGRSGIMFWLSVRGTSVINNIFYFNGRGSAIDSYTPDVSGATFDRNIFFGQTADIDVSGTGFTTGTNYTVDPLFANAASGDFGLQAGSPAIDKGVTLAQVPTDFTGKARPEGAAYDIGTFEGAGSKADVLPAVAAGIPGGGTPTNRSTSRGGLGNCFK